MSLNPVDALLQIGAFPCRDKRGGGITGALDSNRCMDRKQQVENQTCCESCIARMAVDDMAEYLKRNRP